jgi:hypothetical protein
MRARWALFWIHHAWRFVRQSTRNVLSDWFGVEFEEMPRFAPSFNVAPQSVQPVVRLDRDRGNCEFALLRWGLVPFWAKDAKMVFSTINARVQEAAKKPAFREALKKRRCLCRRLPSMSGSGWMPSQRDHLPLHSPAASLLLLRLASCSGPLRPFNLAHPLERCV